MKPFIALSLVALSATSVSALTEPYDETTLQQERDLHSANYSSSNLCTFDIIVKTGLLENAGTQAHISLTLESAAGHNQKLEIQDLESWGKMGPNHKYFQRGNVDVFHGHGACMTTRPCKLLLASDGSGNNPGWYVHNVKVTQIDSDLAQLTHTFNVDRWLAVDQSPYSLDAVLNDCPNILLEMA